MRYRSSRRVLAATNVDSLRERNKASQRKRRKKIKDMKAQNPNAYKLAMQKRNRHKTKYCQKTRTQTSERKLERYRKLISGRVFSIVYLRNLFLELENEEQFDLDAQIQAWRNVCDDSDYKSFDAIVEFVNLQTQKNFYHPQELMQEVTIIYRKQPTHILIPDSAENVNIADDTILWDKENSKLYHFQLQDLVTDEDISVEIVNTTRSLTYSYKDMGLEVLLENYSLNIEDLLNA